MPRRETTDRLRELPSINELLRHPRLAALAGLYRRELVVALARSRVAAARAAAAAGEEVPRLEALAQEVAEEAGRRWRVGPLPLINATGVILHTNLGRAPLSEEAAASALAAATSYTDLEYDSDSGERGLRAAHLEAMLCDLTGAEGALVVNNNASAVLLALSALARGREVLVSRGQAVEIGGGFRVPEVMRQSGAKLVEVGTTNRTYLGDYEQAISPKTAALLHVHTSNFRLVGFIHEVSMEDLASLAHQRGLVALDDLGSGCLLDTTAFGLAKEPMVQESLAVGADLACFSGDKLLGGPQAGIIVGCGEITGRLRKHPLARALRVDKVTIAALAATLLHYIRCEELEKVLVWRMISAPAQGLEQRARAIAAGVSGWRARAMPSLSAVGGGSLPGETLPSWAVVLTPPSSVPGKIHSRLVAKLASALRHRSPPIVARVEKDSVVLDLRTVLPAQDPDVATGLAGALGAMAQG